LKLTAPVLNALGHMPAFGVVEFRL
jgi:hypothetical protein